jgi:ketosteroid isomerase-like protein
MSPAEFFRAYEAAANSHDLDAIMELIAEDAFYWFSDQSAHVGKTAIRKAIAANFNAIKNEHYRIENVIWLATSGEIAACVYGFHWSGEIDGRAASGGGRGTTVLQRIAGNWRITHEHLSRGRVS